MTVVIESVASIFLLYLMFILPAQMGGSRVIWKKRRSLGFRITLGVLIPWIIQFVIIAWVNSIAPGSFSNMAEIGTLFAGWLTPLIVFLIVSYARADDDS